MQSASIPESALLCPSFRQLKRPPSGDPDAVATDWLILEMQAIELRRWRVVLIRNRGQFLGYVEAPSVEAAELLAAKEFNLTPFHRKRLLLRQRL